MIRFNELEALGLSVAAMSDRSDGDCRLPSESNGYSGREGRRAFLENLRLEAEDLVCVRQVHGTSVTEVDGDDRGKGGLDAATAPADSDAIVTTERALPIGVSVADCVPLILVDPWTGILAIGHAGRLGTMGNIAGCMVAAMASRFGVVPQSIHAMIGPSAGPERYEVSEEIAAEFASLGLPRRGRLLDLWGANRSQLEGAGVPSSQISVFGHCTMSDTHFYSHRGDGTGGRNLVVVSL